MVRIKRVCPAKTISCTDAVTKGAKAANVLKSREAKYSNIDIHNVRSADVSNFDCKSVNTVSGIRKNAGTVYAKTYRIRAYRAKCQNGKDNLTLDELFCNMGGRR